MLKYFQDKFDKGRESLSTELIGSILRELLQEEGIELQTSERVGLRFLSALAEYLYANPSYYIKLDEFAVYKHCDTSNILRIDRINLDIPVAGMTSRLSGKLAFKELIQLSSDHSKKVIEEAEKSSKKIEHETEEIKKKERVKNGNSVEKKSERSRKKTNI